MKRFSIAAFVFVAAGTANAATITYTASATPGTVSPSGASFTLPTLSVTQFNLALGTLNSITISADYNFRVTAIAGPLGGNATFAYSGRETVGGFTNGALSVSCNNSTGGSANQDFSFDVNCARTAVTLVPGVSVNPAMGTAVTGTGTVQVGLNNVFQTPFGGPGTTVSTALTSGSVTLTYDYTPSVPEPGTLLLAGLGAGALALRRLRRE